MTASNVIIAMDGMDVYSATTDLSGLGTYSLASDVTWSGTSGRFGSGGITLNGYGSLTKTITGSPTELLVSFSYDVPSLSATVPFLSFLSASGTESSVSINFATQQVLFLNHSGTVIYTSPTLTTGLTAGWHFVEIYALLGGVVSGIATGVMMISIDGTPAATVYTAWNTNGAGGAAYSAISFGTSGSAIGTIDDLIIRNMTGTVGGSGTTDDSITSYSSPGDTIFFGDGRIYTRSPNADASPNNGTPESGTNHYAMVDSLPYNTSDYITMTNTSGQEELYDVASLGATPSSIWAVQVSTIAEKTDAGAANLENLLVSGTATDTGVNNALTTSYQLYRDVFQTDPNTSAAWTVSGVNAAKIGYKVP